MKWGTLALGVLAVTLPVDAATFVRAMAATMMTVARTIPRPVIATARGRFEDPVDEFLSRFRMLRFLPFR
jgi:hypothetical protein